MERVKATVQIDSFSKIMDNNNNYININNFNYYYNYELQYETISQLLLRN